MPKVFYHGLCRCLSWLLANGTYSSIGRMRRLPLTVGAGGRGKATCGSGPQVLAMFASGCEVEGLFRVPGRTLSMDPDHCVRHAVPVPFRVESDHADELCKEFFFGTSVPPPLIASVVRMPCLLFCDVCGWCSAGDAVIPSTTDPHVRSVDRSEQRVRLTPSCRPPPVPSKRS